MSALAISFHGHMMMPMSPVMRPPVLNEICFGDRFAKSLAGLTTLAAMFTEMVATATPSSAMIEISPRENEDAISGSARPGGAVSLVRNDRITTGSHSLPTSTPVRMACAALVIMTPMALNAIIVV